MTGLLNGQRIVVVFKTNVLKSIEYAHGENEKIGSVWIWATLKKSKFVLILDSSMSAREPPLCTARDLNLDRTAVYRPV